MNLLIAVSVIALLVLVTIVKGVVFVSQGFEFTVERFGRYTKTITPGISLIVPFIDRVGRKINMMEQVLDIPPQSAISQDNAVVTVDAVCFFQVQDASMAAYRVTNLFQAMQNLMLTNVRNVLGSLTLDDMLSRRDETNQKILEVVDAATDPWGVKVTRVEIKDIDPPDEIVEAMSKQMKAEREKRAAILDAEGMRQSAIEMAEGDKRSAILRAEGEREAAFKQAEARERLAQAEAKATEDVSNAIKNGNYQAINYFVAQGYTDALAKIGESKNSKVFMLPVDATSIMGSIGGIKKLVDEIGGEK